MNKWIVLLLLLLSVSVTLNVYLLSDASAPIDVNTPTSKHFTTQPERISEQQQNSALNPTFNELKVAPREQFPEINNQVRQQEQSPAKRLELLAQANLWLKNENFLQLVPFLRDYLKRYPQDMEFLLIEAKVNVETTLLSDAIAHYYDLLRKPMTAAQRHEITDQIQQLTTNTIEQLTRNYSWDILAMFVEPLLQLEPDNRLYILSLAKAYAELYQESLMENALASLDFDDQDAQKIRRIIVAHQASQTENTEINETNNLDSNKLETNLGHPIPLQQFGDQYVVNARLSSNQVALLIDTGASITAISKQYFDNLSNRYKVNYLGRFTIATAAGSIMARIYQFRELTINHATVENLPVVVLPLQSIENADGLLGMNFLREFDFKIDQQQSVMFIK
ncbi:retropepsin-like aspartic protease family protein [Paraglaciecola arctica]|uniref:retropepsin-like aspartic protease family protein n=1 Tax=Paraglaciecola arctica TaxID=1128911 RepID=UPI001C076A05|nr:retropepsin-like aspartic protease [Paraglaciecola arctica]MBU3004031.1 retroviral-like aspartic protease family protein [Paraglaciecola arctica]